MGVMRMILWMAAVAACSGEKTALVLDGPARLRVDSLGPVEAPIARLSDGSTPTDLAWMSSNEEVADFEDGQLIARGPGEAQIEATLGDRSAKFTILVEPSVKLVFVDAPATVSVGEEVQLLVEARVSDREVSPELSWSSSDTERVTIEGGLVHAMQPGIVYVTARTGRSQAMVELEVIR
jgi:hypothetical protein